MKLVALALIVLAVLSVPVAVLIPHSLAKGRMRLAGSLLLGGGFMLAAMDGFTDPGRDWRQWVVFGCGAILGYFGVRKYQRDPEGRTPPAQIL